MKYKMPANLYLRISREFRNKSMSDYLRDECGMVFLRAGFLEYEFIIRDEKLFTFFKLKWL